MKHLFITGVFFLLGISVIAQTDSLQFTKDYEEPEPFYFEAAVLGDFARNIKGGMKQRNAYLGLIDIGIGLNTEDAGLWKGGELYLQLENCHGATPTGDYVGDYQTFSNAEAGDNTALYQLWFKQQLGDFSILVGQHDLNADFVASDIGGSFINSSFGIMPSVAANVPISIFPVNALAAFLTWSPSDKFAVLAAVYDGDPGDFETNPYSIKWKLDPDEGAMTIGEIQYNLIQDDKVLGTYKIGGFYHTADFEGLTDSAVYKGNSGFYLIADHTIFEEGSGDEGGLGAFLMLGYSPGDQSEVDMFIGGGLKYYGLIPKRNDDELILAFGHASFNNDLVKLKDPFDLGNETVIEFGYKAVLGDHFEIQPDIQYILNTGGNSELGNSFVGMIRCVASF